MCICIYVYIYKMNMYMYTCLYLYWCLYKGQRTKYICRERVLIDGHLSLPTISAIGEVIVLFTASHPLFSLLFSIS